MVNYFPRGRRRVFQAEDPERLLSLGESKQQALAQAMEELRKELAKAGMGMATYNLLAKLAAHLPGDRPDTRAMMRSLPHNVTTEMDLALWRAAQVIRAAPEARAASQARPPAAAYTSRSSGASSAPPARSAQGSPTS